MPFELGCIRDGNIRHFKGTYQDNGSEIRFILEDEGHDQQTQGYIIDFTLIAYDDDSMRIQIMDIHINKYKGIGIPDALIMKAKELLVKQIVSSSMNNFLVQESSIEGISSDSKKVWGRLVARGLAFYDSEENCYKTFSPLQER